MVGVLTYTKEHGNRVAEWHFKKIIIEKVLKKSEFGENRRIFYKYIW